MSARVWWKPWTWLRRPAEGVRHLSDLFDHDLVARNKQLALDEAARLAQRAGIVFAPGTLSAIEVEALARAREVLELERLGAQEGLLREFVRVLRGTDEDTQDFAALAAAGGG